MRLSSASVLFSAAAGVVATVAAVVTGSVGLLGFGLDSVVDGAASCVLIWRFQSEGRGTDRAGQLERRAARAVGVALMGSGLFVAARAVIALGSHSRAATAAVGVIIAAASVIVLPPLAAAKRRVAIDLSSRALLGDSVLTAMGAVLAAVALAGLGATRLLGWWWADSVAALAIALVLGRESVEILRTRA